MEKLLSRSLVKTNQLPFDEFELVETMDRDRSMRRGHVSFQELGKEGGRVGESGRNVPARVA